MKYQDRLNEHLANYKQTVLGISAAGTWLNPKTKQKIPYDHILPEGSRNKNIVAAFREQFWNDFEHWAELEPHHVVKLHKFFAHLNSSQALCFNLFYPLIADHDWCLTFISKVLEMPGEVPKKQWFEWIEDLEEETNYDFFIEMQSGKKVFFEVKLSEMGFGTAKTDERHLKKLAKIYEPKLSLLVDPKWLEPQMFCARYQLLRNMCHLGDKDHTLFLVVPRANESLQPALKELPEITAGALKGRVRVLYLEDVLERVNEVLRPTTGLLNEQYIELQRKYIV